jgi:hypothetical protein
MNPRHHRRQIRLAREPQQQQLQQQQQQQQQRERERERRRRDDERPFRNELFPERRGKTIKQYETTKNDNHSP